MDKPLTPTQQQIVLDLLPVGMVLRRDRRTRHSPTTLCDTTNHRNPNPGPHVFSTDRDALLRAELIYKIPYQREIEVEWYQLTAAGRALGEQLQQTKSATIAAIYDED